jgi:hypothetical protein
VQRTASNASRLGEVGEVVNVLVLKSSVARHTCQNGVFPRRHGLTADLKVIDHGYLPEPGSLENSNGPKRRRRRDFRWRMACERSPIPVPLKCTLGFSLRSDRFDRR